MVIRILLQTILGFILSFSGLRFAYAYITGLSDGNKFWLLGIATILVGAGVFLLLRASKSNSTVITQIDEGKLHQEKNQAVNAKTGLESIVEKNNELSAQWSKTVEARDRLKTLE